MKITMGYPNEDDEVDILFRFKQDNPLTDLKAVADGGQIIELRKQVRKVHVERSIGEYIVEIVQRSAARTCALVAAREHHCI